MLDILFNKDFKEFIFQWQTLIGSALGPFLAIVFSVFAYGIKVFIHNRKERKEFLRRIEIGITRSLDDTIKTRKKLQKFVVKLKELIVKIRSVENDREFSLESINFPGMRKIYADTDVTFFGIKSYYLHNKILWADTGIHETNEVVFNLKNDFIELQRKNELHIILMRQNSHPNPKLQRKQYADNLTFFADAIEDFCNNYMNECIDIMIQIKVYNESLRKKFGRYFLWKHEGTGLKYFKNKLEQKKFSKNLNSISRIDESIKEDFDKLKNEIEERVRKLT